MRIPVGRSVYKRGFAKEPAVELINRFFEQDPTNTIDQVALLSRPATNQFFEGPDDKVLRHLVSSTGAFNNDLFVVSGSTVWRYFLKQEIGDDPFERLKPIENNPIGWWEIGINIFPFDTASYKSPVLESEIITGPGYEIFFITDGTRLYSYDSREDDGITRELKRVKVPGETFISDGVEFEIDGKISTLAQINKYLLCAIKDKDRFYFIRPGKTKIDPLDFYTAEKQSDVISAIRVVGDNIVIMGESTIEFWYPSKEGGIDADIFIPYTANALNVGVQPGTAKVIDDNLFFVGTDNIIYKFNQGIKRISTHAIEEIVRTSVEKKVKAEGDIYGFD